MQPVLETSRLRLREFEESDLDSLFALDSNPEVMRFIGAVRSREEIEQALPKVMSYYEKHPGLGIWVLERKHDSKFLGWACLKDLDQTEMIELGYRLMPAAWNQGFATEAGQALVQYGFEQLNLTRIVGITNPENLASQRVLEKCGLKRNGTGTFYNVEVFFFERNADD